MKIAYVFDPLLPQSETDTEQALNTVTALSKRGAEVVMFLPRPTLEAGVTAAELRDYYRLDADPRIVLQRSLYAVPRVEVAGLSPSRAIEKLGHALRTFASRRLRDYDLIYTRNIPVAIAALASGHRVAYETYRPWPQQHPAMIPILSRMMRNRTFLGGIFHSAYTRDVFAGIGVAGERLEVVYNGYRPSLFEPRLSQTEARIRLGRGTDRPLVVYTGRVSPQKGLGLVADAAEKLPEIDFLFVGSEGEGEIEGRAQSLSNLDVVGWTPYDELPTYLFAADILIIPPSLGPLQRVGNTVLPMKLFLYLAAGRAILAPHSPDTEELLKHDDNAWLVAPDDIDAACAGIRHLATNRPLAERIGERARKMAAGLTWDARAQKILGFLEGRLQAAR